MQMPLEAVTTLCPVCGEELPPPKPRGRPRVFCGLTCTQRARSRRRRASGLLEYVERLSVIADEKARNTRPYGGNGKSELRHSEHLRAKAAELLEGLPR